MTKTTLVKAPGKIRRFATRTIHDVPLTFENEGGERIQEKFSVVYRSYSTKTIEDFEQSFAVDKRSDGTVPFSAMLGKMVVSITDSEGEALTDDTGQPADLDQKFFAGIPIEEARGLYDRIQADIFPQTASSSAGVDGSPAAANEA